MATILSYNEHITYKKRGAIIIVIIGNMSVIADTVMDSGKVIKSIYDR